MLFQTLPITLLTKHYLFNKTSIIFQIKEIHDFVNDNLINDHESIACVHQVAAGVWSKGGLTMKTPFQVFVAKYAYDPVQYSPNENPEAELGLSIGDYIFVYGNIDEVLITCSNHAIN